MNNPTDRAHEVRDNAGDVFKSKYACTSDIVKEQSFNRITHDNETYLQQQRRLKREGRIFWGCIVLAGLLTFAGEAYHMWRLK